jgi:hypothetical protein
MLVLWLWIVSSIVLESVLYVMIMMTMMIIIVNLWLMGTNFNSLCDWLANFPIWFFKVLSISRFFLSIFRFLMKMMFSVIFFSIKKIIFFTIIYIWGPECKYYELKILEGIVHDNKFDSIYIFNCINFYTYDYIFIYLH